MRAARLRFSRLPPTLLSLCPVASQLGHLGQCSPRPTRQLAISELVGDADRMFQVLLRLVQPADLPFRDAAGGSRVGELPASAQLREDGHSAIEPGQAFFGTAELVEDPTLLH